MDHFSFRELQYLFSCESINPRHKTWLRSIYSLGLSIEEMIQAKVKDFDWLNSTLRVSVGLRARTMMLPKTLAYELRKNTFGKSPEDYLFSGRNGKLHRRTILKAFESVGELTGMEITSRKLKKSLLLHLFEQGWNDKKIAQYLGYRNTRAPRKHIFYSGLTLDYEHPIDKLCA
jgi:integrase